MHPYPSRGLTLAAPWAISYSFLSMNLHSGERRRTPGAKGTAEISGTNSSKGDRPTTRVRLKPLAVAARPGRGPRQAAVLAKPAPPSLPENGSKAARKPGVHNKGKFAKAIASTQPPSHARERLEPSKTEYASLLGVACRGSKGKT